MNHHQFIMRRLPDFSRFSLALPFGFAIEVEVDGIASLGGGSLICWTDLTSTSGMESKTVSSPIFVNRTFSLLSTTLLVCQRLAQLYCHW
jgi:hypothetical protein